MHKGEQDLFTHLVTVFHLAVVQNDSTEVADNLEGNSLDFLAFLHRGHLVAVDHDHAKNNVLNNALIRLFKFFNVFLFSGTVSMKVLF